MRVVRKLSLVLMCSCYIINQLRHAFAYTKADSQAGVAMANQDWETKLENEMRIVRRLLRKIRGQTEVTPIRTPTRCGVPELFKMISFRESFDALS